MFKINRENVLIVLLLIVLILAIINNMGNKTKNIFKYGLPISNKVIIIDAGHGGIDAGTSGKLKKTEQVINLEIAKKLQQYLEQGGAYVVLTRADENGLYDKNAKNKKRSDFAKRKDIINNSHADIIISIHQNYFSESKYSGAQVFYKAHCEVSKDIAKCIQSEFKNILNKNNNRIEKESSEYYLFKNSKIPIILLECGFLSNANEEVKLNNSEYQENIAWAIYKGVLIYYANFEKK
ncbi:MAG: hypothetical protein A2Y24_03080 [Clostridiales bacterium GWE2_32_10]|nr:MAG: hypothetical protein A2Y24_03080 [Clostridiales bacterium GWE2_32_10]HBY21701.1 N-acetylmuramoyl-L-alanine amidase [Clostridiales bacterium]